ncbi:PREDICTED: fluoride export protein 1-like [Camelina sativa]|uniref:Fluoride export protein 1-like n=1 Tax=Camelina sativa TaxID=90675 RepID=A0ABM0YU94_CAMSA|nr:PREDICTED: fluoride export protein 1-like [Camelina sativa]XP_010505965.1 PREDICTED: fluoride export protein 1-like [Camelina sativa]
MATGQSRIEPYRTKSFSRESSLSSSLSLSRSLPHLIDNDVDGESVSEAGDIGDRSLRRRHSAGRSSRLSADDLIEQGTLDTSRQEQDVLHDLRAFNTDFVVKPLPENITPSPLPTKSLLSPPEEIDRGKEEEYVLPKSLEYISCLIHLAVFGIFGAITRYLLQKLFGPTGARVTSDGSILYLDLPSNMVGSFLMGWFGVVFKADIARVSEFVAIGLSTGYLGSLTTFSGWNQKMLDLSADGQWVFAVLGFLLGLFLTSYSIILGVETAKGFKWLLHRRASSEEKNPCLKVNTFQSHIVSLTLMLVLLVALLTASSILLVKEFDKGTSEAQLWLGCLVAAPGVWLRWFLARLNGRGLGKDGQHLRWVPFGTLIANVAAACVMAALATLKKSVNTRTCNTVASSIQFGLLGCLSTVSTLMAEFNAMRESDYPWRAYAYASFTIAVSFAIGTVIYSVPVWTVGFS